LTRRLLKAALEKRQERSLGSGQAISTDMPFKILHARIVRQIA